jgi:hypothetical protein
MKLVQITPLDRKRLYGGMVKKEAEIRKKRAGAFYRVGTRKRDKTRWRHAKFKGWIDVERGRFEVVTAKVNSLDWQLLAAFVGWVDRHFGDQVLSVNIQYRSP